MNNVLTDVIVLDGLKIRLKTIKKKIEAQKAAAKRASSSATPTNTSGGRTRASPAATPMLSRSPAHM